MPDPFKFGNTSRTEPGLLGPGAISLDLLLAKEFRFTESTKLQLRSEFYNAMNHFNPGKPNATIGNAAVGTITGGSGGRTIQISMKLHF